ncbi:MAG: HlyD family secretion protein [Burkholderiales bacterium]|jgi:membrane fusion protein (multidrug efflux system)|nr:HlyD family secretion protein [Burkholderiales bacterium]
MTTNDQNPPDSPAPPPAPAAPATAKRLAKSVGLRSLRPKRALILVRRNRKWTLVAVGVVALLVAGVWGYERLGHVTENDARVKADMITVSSRVGGWVIERPVTDGQFVHAGQELIVIDQREADLKLTELRAKAESLRLRREQTNIRHGMVGTTAHDAVAAAKANNDAAASKLEQAQREFQRADELRGRIVSHELWEQRQTQLRQAEAAALAASTALSDAQAKLGDIGILRKDVDTLAQEAAQLDAQIRVQEIDVADRRVKSPIDGIVDQKFVEPGEYVVPGQRLFIIHDTKKVWVDADIKETKLDRLRLGQPVNISVDAYPDRRFVGHIERIGNATTGEFALLPSPNPSGNFTKITQRVPVRIAVEQPDDNPLRPGMMVEVDIDTHPR